MEKKNAFVKDIISRMTVEQKVGAVMTLAFTGVVPKRHTYDYITKYNCGGLRLTATVRGSILYVDPRNGSTKEGDFGSFRNRIAPSCTASEYKAVLQEFQKLAKSRPLSIPLHFSLDQEGSTTSNFCFGGATLFSKPMGLRATNDPKMAYLVARAMGEQCKAVGYNWVHSPVLDINSDPRNPEICVRAYSDNAEEVVLYAAETCRGYKDAGMITAGKHFPGRGFSAVDAHYDVPVIDVDEKTLWERELLPYRELIAKDLLPSIMIAHSIFPAIDPDNIATVSKPIITGLLRDKLGYEGVITTDSMTMGGVVKRYGVANACALSLEAGADIVLMKAENHLVDETYNAIMDFVKSGRIPEEELDNKVYRILNMKYNYGLFHDYANDDVVPEDVLKRKEITELSKEVAKRSVLVCRDNAKLLPLMPEERVLVIEQKNGNFNDLKWHSGILYENCARYSRNVDYLETEYRWDEIDLERISNAIKKYDKVVVTNYYSRTALCNIDELRKLLKTEKNIVVVTNTPYEEISIPDNAESVVVTFATSPDNIEVVAGVIFGKTVPEAVWPVSHHA